MSPTNGVQLWNFFQTTPCATNANPQRDGVDFVNLNNFAQYQIDGKYHLKYRWDFGESIEWRQEESIFENNIQATISGRDIEFSNFSNHKFIVNLRARFSSECDLGFSELTIQTVL